ncbi:MAG TPA: succinate--CoA ligase subunit alpha [Spirochaetia bacterium]|nr:succinate--CoA ligase subunit alpha [Spirochaetia bacterium]
MAIIIDENTRVIVQNITGRQGAFHTRQMLAFGTKVVGGTAPGKGGQTVDDVPVYDTVDQAVRATGADASVIFIPAAGAKDGAFEAMDAGIKILVIITEHIPVSDEIDLVAYARQKGVTVIGPNTFGIVSSGKCKIGIPSNHFFVPGPVGVVARSGTLTYEIAGNLMTSGLGQSTVVGLGGDRAVGLSFVEVLAMFEADPATKAVVLIGEIGGNAEEEAARYIAAGMSKPVVGYIAGKSAPPGKRMGHAGAIIERGKGTFAGKVEALQKAGVQVASLPNEVPGLVRNVL